MFLRSISAISLCALVAALAACGSTSEDPTAESEDAAHYVAGFPGGSYFQIDHAHPANGEISLIMFSSPTTFWAERCINDACDAAGINGTYKRSIARIYLYDANGVHLGTWSYTLHDGTLKLHETGTSDRYALDPMSEDLCDSSGGAWSDDDFGAHGFNCACPGEMDWGPTGCDAATAPHH